PSRGHLHHRLHRAFHTFDKHLAELCAVRFAQIGKQSVLTVPPAGVAPLKPSGLLPHRENPLGDFGIELIDALIMRTMNRRGESQQRIADIVQSSFHGFVVLPLRRKEVPSPLSLRTSASSVESERVRVMCHLAPTSWPRARNIPPQMQNLGIKP